ncbi:MAG: hypothetical protein J4F31_08280 [Flavobacteriales bacterium]|nr:hypothetical protein [Flavobacteriales bacterium]
MIILTKYYERLGIEAERITVKEMRSINTITVLALFLGLFSPWRLIAHPNGGIVVVGEGVCWSYIYPVDDVDHHACIFRWNQNDEPEVLIRSDYPASDYFLSSMEGTLYIVERAFVRVNDTFKCRVLKLSEKGEAIEIWPWFEDPWRTAEGGFFMLSDTELVFARYPKLYSPAKGGEPEVYFDFDHAVNKIRGLDNDEFLILAEDNCFLVSGSGKILNEWRSLVEPTVENVPLNRNMVFDVDYRAGELLVAYWGNRSFLLMDSYGGRRTIVQRSAPFVPHWVAFVNNCELLFSSKMFFDSRPLKPHLIMHNGLGETQEVWTLE